MTIWRVYQRGARYRVGRPRRYLSGIKWARDGTGVFIWTDKRQACSHADLKNSWQQEGEAYKAERWHEVDCP